MTHQKIAGRRAGTGRYTRRDARRYTGSGTRQYTGCCTGCCTEGSIRPCAGHHASGGPGHRRGGHRIGLGLGQLRADTRQGGCPGLDSADIDHLTRAYPMGVGDLVVLRHTDCQLMELGRAQSRLRAHRSQVPTHKRRKRVAGAHGDFADRHGSRSLRAGQALGKALRRHCGGATGLLRARGRRGNRQDGHGCTSTGWAQKALPTDGKSTGPVKSKIRSHTTARSHVGPSVCRPCKLNQNL